MADPSTLLSLGKDFGVPLLSAVLGAMLAYLPAARLAKKASDEMLVRDREQRTEAELTEARRAFVKLTLLVNTLGSFRQDVEGMIAKATLDGNDHMPLSQRMSVFAGIEDEPVIAFDAAELAPFIAARRPDLADDLLLLQRRHAAVVHGLRSFARLKLELHYMVAGHGTTTRDEALVSTTHARVPRDLANVFRLNAEELELFTESLRKQINDFADYAARVAALFGEVTEGYFGKGALPVLAPMDGAPSIPVQGNQADGRGPAHPSGVRPHVQVRRRTGTSAFRTTVHRRFPLDAWSRRRGARLLAQPEAQDLPMQRSLSAAAPPPASLMA